MEQEQVQVDVQEVLRITQLRLQASTEQNILMEALLNHRADEIEELKKALDALGKELNGNEGKQAQRSDGETR